MTKSTTLFTVALVGLSVIQQAMADDWPAWRGARRDAISRETGLMKQWPEGGPKLLWKTELLGAGYSGPAVVGNVLYTMGNRDGREWVLALDVDRSGQQLWALPIGPVEYDGFNPGPRATPGIDGERLYAMGASGTLVCIDLRTRKIVWSKSVVKDFGGIIQKWGCSESVLIDGERLIWTPGGKRATIAALDKMSGRTVWTSPIGDQATYSSIIRATIDGVKQYVQFTGDGVVGVRAEDGKFLWRYDAPSYPKYGGINISTCIAFGNTVFAAVGYGIGGGLVQIKRDGQTFTADEVYFTKDMKNHHGGMILLDGYLYGSNDPGILTCMEYSTGKVIWRNRRPGKCSLLYADGRLYCRDENGPLSLVEATPEGFRLHGQFDQPDRSDQKAWPHLVVANGRMYVRDQGLLLCYDVRAGRGISNVEQGVLKFEGEFIEVNSDNH